MRLLAPCVGLALRPLLRIPAIADSISEPTSATRLPHRAAPKIFHLYSALFERLLLHRRVCWQPRAHLLRSRRYLLALCFVSWRFLLVQGRLSVRQKSWL